MIIFSGTELLSKTSDEIIETIYLQIKNSTVEMNSVVPDSLDVSPSEEDHFLFSALTELISKSELIVIPPFRFDEHDGIYKFRDIYFSRMFMPADDGTRDSKTFYVQLVEKISEEEALEKKRTWLIEGKLLEETLSKNPSEKKIKELQNQLGDGYESPYTLVPTPGSEENS